MKLLEELSSTTEHRPPQRRPTVILAATGVGLALAAVFGVILLMAGGGGDDRTDVPVAGPSADVAMAEWVDGVSQACTQTAATHPILTQGDEARTDPDNVVATDVATRDLAVAVRGVALPTDSAEAEAATEAVRLGDQADQAWYALAAQPADKVTTAQLTAASDATSAFVSGLSSLGAAGCDDIA